MTLAEHTPSLWRRLITRIDPRAYLTIHIVIGLVVCLLTAWLFAALLDSVREHDVLVTRDQAVANWFHGNGTALGDRVFVIISMIGSPAAMAVLFGAAALYLWRAKQRTLLVAWVLSYVGGTILDGVIKYVVRRPRPEFAAKFLHYSSWSFPSGHSMGSLIGFSMLAYTIIRVRNIESTAAKIGIWAGAIVMIALVGYSRIYLGVHYLSDVVAGYTLGVLWLAVCFTGLELVNRRAELRRAPST
ncbi:MAG: phosphoesterase PA-phosphatase related protein [Gemmatimonadetes bacterium]|jgi:membrane-associated phospholipid phosphatase|nr:phosphoesterase PA-phosphatase related protein [Gemmatimonadota bacterium]